MVAPIVIISTAIVVDWDAALEDFTPFLIGRVAAVFVTAVQDWAPRCIGRTTVLLAFSSVFALFLTLGAAEFTWIKATVSALKGRIIAAKSGRTLALLVRWAADLISSAAAPRVRASVAVWAVNLWVVAARPCVRNTFAIAFILS